MVGNTRGAADTRRFRRLKAPQPLEVEQDGDALPRRVRLGGAWRDVTLGRRPWRIDQHWWRGEAISRVYYVVVPEDSAPLTVYFDLHSRTWFRQAY